MRHPSFQYAASDRFIWIETKIGQGTLRSARHPITGSIECCVFDFLAAHKNPPGNWHEWTRIVHAAGFPLRFVVIGDRVEALAPHAAIKYLLDNYGSPSPERRGAYAQLRQAERKARGNV